MSYKYERIPENVSNEYLDNLSRIEDMRKELKINQNKLCEIMQADIYESTKIEGNTLTRDEVTFYLETGVTIRGKSMRDYVQVDNFGSALESMKQMVKKPQEQLTEDLICMMHRIITHNELPVSESGAYRNDSVHIRTTTYIPPIAEEVPEKMRELVDEYNKPLQNGYTQFEKICEFKRNFERIHPFFDGNGRTGRALMNLLFLQNGYAYISFPATERDLYFDSLDNNTFSELAAEKMIESMEKIREVHNQKRTMERSGGYDER